MADFVKMSKLEISEVQIVPIKPRDGLLGFASCVINGCLYVGSIAIHTSPSSIEGFRLVYPAKVLPNGKEVNCIHPITKEAGELLSNAIIARFKIIVMSQSRCLQNADNSRVLDT